MLKLAFNSCLDAKNAGICQTHGTYRHQTRRISSHELIFVRQGRLGMFEEDRQFEVNQGEALFLWPDRLHGGSSEYTGELIFYWIHFYLRSPTPSLGESRDWTELQQHSIVSRPDHLTVLFRRYLDDQESYWLNRFMANTLLQLMFMEVAETRPYPNSSSMQPESLASKALAYIRSNISETMTTSKIAKELRCNPDYLGRVFKHSLGYTITDAIHRQRLRKAQKLLLDSEMNVDEISRSCGFDEPAYFRKVFKKYEGLSPRSFRRLYGRLHVNRN